MRAARATVILLGGVVLFSAVAGVIRGFLREICSLITWILAFWLAWKFGPQRRCGGVGADRWFVRRAVDDDVKTAGTFVRGRF